MLHITNTKKGARMKEHNKTVYSIKNGIRKSSAILIAKDWLSDVKIITKKEIKGVNVYIFKESKKKKK